MNKLLFFTFFCLFSVYARAQSQINFQISGLNATWVMAGYYQGGKTYRLDSLRVEPIQGKFSLQRSGLSPGFYFCASDKGVLFDFLVTSPNDSFFIVGNLNRLDSLWAVNSPENENYFRFEQARKSIETAFEAKKSMRSMVAQATKNDKSALEAIDLELDALLQRTDSLATAYIAQRPSSLFAKMLRAVRPPEAPKQLLTAKSNTKLIQWQRQHYWDNTDFSDESLLNNKFWQVYFDGFFAKYVASNPDSIIAAVDNILAKTPRNGAFYRFIVLRVTQYFEMNEAPGADRVFVHMVDKYQNKGRTPWLDVATLERLAYKADNHRPNLTGSMAVNFTLPDETGKEVELYEINAPLTLLVFYSPLCAHCMEMMPKIYQIYLDYQPKNLAAVALNTDKETAYWKKFVQQQNWAWHDVSSPEKMEQLEKQFAVSNLPLIYLLDKDKRIIGKRIKAENLGQVLANAFAKERK